MTKSGISAFFIALLVTNLTFAAEATAPATMSPRAGLAVIDWVIVFLYASGTICLGWYFSRKQSTTEEYFVGSGSMNPILIGVSLFATLLSTITYLSTPGESLGKGPVYFTSLLAMPITFYIVGFILLPVYMRQKVTSAYELLEAKLGLSIRMLGACMFILLRLVWMSLLIYMTSKAIVEMTGLADRWIPVVALVTGTVAVVYTSLGGLRAVVITDAMQTILLYGGAVTVIAMVTWHMGGFGWFPTKWDPQWDKQPILPENARTRLTVLGAILNALIWSVCTAGGDQTSVQRFMATKDAKSARLALATQLTVGLIVSLTLALVGFALLGYFKEFPEQIPAGLDLKDDADKMFTNFIAFNLPPGVSGFVVAAMFAAAMSSIDSGVNSITAVVMTDGLDRFGRKPRTEKEHVRISRWMALGIGLLVVICSSAMGGIPGNYTAVTQKTSNLLTTPIFGLFFFALFVPFASPKGVWVGAICGTATAVLVAFSGPIVYALYLWFDVDPAIFGTEVVELVNKETGEVERSVPDPISFQWISLAAISVNVVTGCIASKIFPKPKTPSTPEQVETPSA
ncbi:sodium:solute symporter family transporter [Thalassoglobus polymorphus]|uniref:Sodium/glucose cotransporter n=1 Tax=Thalassoglobus polymorphus TaxID=2527994 RepID=A0A517QU47_9PLAN|nr:sodium/solute symporter [Thalassoglobus polymorphus]QDT35153.1 Sodium/glucose cotransporter [Thalassoglobus polymorphus]